MYKIIMIRIMMMIIIIMNLLSTSIVCYLTNLGPQRKDQGFTEFMGIPRSKTYVCAYNF